MQLKNLLQEDDAVSPVIGVILMVAITVILAAVIASFVLGLGGNTQQNPQASFSWNYEEHNNSNTNTSAEIGVTTISHDSGDSIVASELYVRGSGFAGPANVDNSTYSGTLDIHENTGDKIWPDDEASGEKGDSAAVVSGDTVDVAVQSSFDLDLVWQPAEGDTSATLSEETGPDA